MWSREPAVCVRCAGLEQGAANVAGVRVVYYNQRAKGRVWLLLIYAKSARDNLPGHVLNAAREMLEDAQD
jgi:hypothetical protein